MFGWSVGQVSGAWAVCSLGLLMLQYHRNKRVGVRPSCEPLHRVHSVGVYAPQQLSAVLEALHVQHVTVLPHPSLQWIAALSTANEAEMSRRGAQTRSEGDEVRCVAHSHFGGWRIEQWLRELHGERSVELRLLPLSAEERELLALQQRQQQLLMDQKKREIGARSKFVEQSEGEETLPAERPPPKPVVPHAHEPTLPFGSLKTGILLPPPWRPADEKVWMSQIVVACSAGMLERFWDPMFHPLRAQEVCRGQYCYQPLAGGPAIRIIVDTSDPVKMWHRIEGIVLASDDPEETHALLIEIAKKVEERSSSVVVAPPVPPAAKQEDEDKAKGGEQFLFNSSGEEHPAQSYWKGLIDVDGIGWLAEPRLVRTCPIPECNYHVFAGSLYIGFQNASTCPRPDPNLQEGLTMQQLTKLFL